MVNLLVGFFPLGLLQWMICNAKPVLSSFFYISALLFIVLGALCSGTFCPNETGRIMTLLLPLYLQKSCRRILASVLFLPVDI